MTTTEHRAMRYDEACGLAREIRRYLPEAPMRVPRLVGDGNGWVVVHSGRVFASVEEWAAAIRETCE